ncbi:hypothetical protein N657DRAFT_659132 [Parathielavia appendiculata]|uniref:Uncharacterized protein n=1 Tax=Parathielavia appendiculata TaxID=2587402 RepID=A0AAN6TRD5_9PEZI|nr:hypothetical protein N657DRAFT_659132 [Parathielavia appendiculata]
MAVLHLGWLVAASAWLPAVSADLGREQPIPGGPVQTLAADLREPRLNALPPVVTARAVPMALQKRAIKTCGYVDGDQFNSYACAHSAAECIHNTEASAVGCCATESCLIWTACLPSLSSAATRTMDADRTRYCSDSKSPSCATLIYADPTNTYLSGYTIPICDTVATTYKIYWSPTGVTSKTTESSTARTTTESETSETSDSKTSSSSRESTGTRATATSTSTNDPAPSVASSESSTPVGPIVGGVVGGRLMNPPAALGLLGLAIFFLIRRKNKNDPPSPPANPAAVAASGFMPPPGQGPYPNPTPPPNMAGMPHSPGSFDPRYSMMKPAGATAVDSMQGPPHAASGDFRASDVSPGSSPSPVYHPQMQSMGAVPSADGMRMNMGTPPPAQHMGMGTPLPPQNGPYVPYPGPQVQHHQQQQHGHGAVELPTQRGDGEVHELS